MTDWGISARRRNDHEPAAGDENCRPRTMYGCRMAAGILQAYPRVWQSQARFPMTRHLLTGLALLAAASLAAPTVGHAQAFKVEKFDIKGDGGTDYVAVEAATGA